MNFDVPAEMIHAIVSAAPFAADEIVKIVHLGTKDGPVAQALAARLPRATVSYIERNLDKLDWSDRMFGAGLVVAVNCVHDLPDAKKQYLYKAAADRMTPHGALLIADRLAPRQLLHHLVWLKHAGFPQVDCFWLRDGVAVFGGFKQAEASAGRPPGDS